MNEEELMKEARRTAETAGLKLLDQEEGLVLTDGTLELTADFARDLHRVKRGNLQRELLVRAAKIKRNPEPEKGAGDKALTAVDATAGFGEDSLLLAAAGFSVTLFELNPVIAALLQDALRRAGEIPELKDAADRMKMICGDSVTQLPLLSFRPDIILLDPMVPERTKSALVKKKFQLLHLLEQPCADEEALLEAAGRAGASRIIIKRPLKGPYLAHRKPSYSLEGKTIRYDVIVC